ncbi:AmmeMemoRadiSam system protein A [Candidatus Woesearchaeota archaeon]|nr:AmmeMemoRadiSam system protein A [Candidatus Woesearchaeota archaeon]
MVAFSRKLGHELLVIARKTVNAAFSNENLRLKPEVKTRLAAELGVFVNIYRRNELRGSFGYPPGTYSLAEGIKRASRGAAFMDPRFGALTKAEFNNVRFEVTLIKKLKLLKVKKPGEYLKKINPKRHGLFIRYGPFMAMQLPKFAVRQGFSARDFLEKTVEKAGLAPEAWHSPNLKVFIFYAQSFSE